jgi:phosphoribosyl-ATP pyrophosphohydrolase/phosphoribosyl-AMP cyclohydrolase
MMIDFEKSGGLIPVIVQDAKTLQVLMLGYANEEAWGITLKTKYVTFFSRSRNALWTKGETSGNYLHMTDYFIDCDNDTILILANPVGSTCHRGTTTCFDVVNDRGDVVKCPPQLSNK